MHYGFPTYPDGLLRTSPTDLGLFLAAIQGGGVTDGVRILSEESVNAMLTVDESIASEGAGQAAVWSRIELNTGRMLMGHTGGDWGVGAFLGIDREAGVGALIVVTQVDFDIEELVTAYDTLFEIAASAEL